MTSFLKKGEVLNGSAGRYRIVEQIGKGGQAAVYRAEHKDALVAVKIFDGDGEKETRRAAFLRARKLRALTPAILPSDIVEVAGGRGRGYAMRLVQAPSLLDYIEGRETAGSFADEFKFCADLAAGLAMLHDQGISHGDIQPENILRLPGNQVCFLDLDNYCAAGQPSPPTMIGQAFWYAPELRASRHGKDVSAASDVFSLALVLHQVLLRKHDYAHCANLDQIDTAAASGWHNDPFNGRVAGADGYPASMFDTRMASLMRASLSPRPGDRPTAAQWRDLLVETLEQGRLFFCPHCGQPIFLDIRSGCPHCAAHLGTPGLVAGGSHIAIGQGGRTLGRAELGSPHVSSRHVHVQGIGPFLRVTDLRSTNGTWHVDHAGQWRRLAADQAALLAPGSKLRCADVELEVSP